MPVGCWNAKQEEAKHLCDGSFSTTVNVRRKKWHVHTCHRKYGLMSVELWDGFQGTTKVTPWHGWHAVWPWSFIIIPLKYLMSVVYTTSEGGGVSIVSPSVVALYVQKNVCHHWQDGDNRNGMLAFAGKHNQTDTTCHLVLWQHTDQHAALVTFHCKCILVTLIWWFESVCSAVHLNSTVESFVHELN